MAQHDGVIDNAPGATFRADINAAIAALISNNSGASAPSTTYAYMFWADTSSGLLKQRNAANNAWITIGTLADENYGLLKKSGDSLTGGLNLARGSVTMHATTMNLWAQPNIIDGTSAAVIITAIANAPQAGATRKLYPPAGTKITHGATFDVEGASDYTTVAGDALIFEAITVSTYKVWIDKDDGTSVTANISDIKSFTAVTNTPANGVTITIPAGSLQFRSTTLSSGTPVTRTIASPISLVISSGSTLGASNGVASRIAVLAIDNAGTVEVAAVNLAGGMQLDETNLISTTAEGGAGGADSATVVYSTIARTNVAYRVIGFYDETQTTAGTHVSALTLVQGAGGESLAPVVLHANGAAPMFACRAWVNFNGTGTVAIRGSGNVLSITDNGVGDYTINFITPMEDTNYAVNVTASLSTAGTTNTTTTGGLSGSGTTLKTTSSCRIWTKQTSTLADADYIDVVIFR